VLGYTGNPNSTAAEVKGCVSRVGKGVFMLKGGGGWWTTRRRRKRRRREEEQVQEQQQDVRWYERVLVVLVKHILVVVPYRNTLFAISTLSTRILCPSFNVQHVFVSDSVPASSKATSAYVLLAPPSSLYRFGT
jgi:hypothetical protein